ncbi:hypothetical protein [Mesorhizobium marinum]|uniref:Uncharacterized protein n=1 Tax=Mesorhizobium marinum TaxID=3228790 RepID=A0ABV3R2E4_9HYPH
MSSALEHFGLPLSPEGMGLLVFCIAGVAAIAMLARKEFRADLRRRGTLLDAAAGLVGDAQVTIGGDGYPRLLGTSSGNRISMEVVADSLVPRRLPQLWLKLTMLAPEPRPRPSIGVLARPVGTEFYSRVLGLPDTIAPSFSSDMPLLMRGSDVTDDAVQRTSGLFRTLLSDPGLKEIVITPRGAGLVRQIAEGDRGAHVLYRQIRFPVEQVPADLVRNALDELRLLNDVLDAAPQTLEASR